MSLAIQFLETGFCTHPEFVVLRGGGLHAARFPSSVAVIKHPVHGTILFDAGYASHFYDATDRYPEKLYRHVTPVHSLHAESAAAQLARLGVDPQDVRYVILSHFHGDHIAGIKDFPRAKLIFAAEAYDSVKGLRGIRAVLNGYLPSLLPADFAERAQPLAREQLVKALPFAAFPEGFDIFGDGSIIGVPLPGHVTGHMGLYIRAEKPYFLVSDACWLERAFKEGRLPHFATRLIIDDFRAYGATIDKIRALHFEHQDVQVVPCHCETTLARMRGTSP